MPEGGIFKLGVKVVTYYAQDSSGLSSRCERTINVRGTVEILLVEIS